MQGELPTARFLDCLMEIVRSETVDSRSAGVRLPLRPLTSGRPRTTGSGSSALAT
jgi:hypothetical protein